ncbi:MAG: hypothetical protein K6G23_03995 [Lachnospiraceae bacterium]|nr:hypothetical protein [Lachnospiraceae bacterium]
MNRFESRFSQLHILLRKVFPLLLLVVILGIFVIALQRIDRSSYDNQLESLQNAIHRDIMQCYALEGTYPPSLDYLTQHYGLTYNTDLFFVDYQVIASNIYPDITILPVDKEAYED